MCFGVFRSLPFRTRRQDQYPDLIQYQVRVFFALEYVCFSGARRGFRHFPGGSAVLYRRCAELDAIRKSRIAVIENPRYIKFQGKGRPETERPQIGILWP